MSYKKTFGIVAAGGLLAVIVSANAFAAGPDRTGYIFPSHHFLYENNKSSASVGSNATLSHRTGYIFPSHNFLYENGAQHKPAAVNTANNATTERTGYIFPSHNFLYE